MLITRPAALSLAQMQIEAIAFMTDSGICDRQGQVYSWLNPKHPGFIYPEIMGFYLTLISQLSFTRSDRAFADIARRVANRLQSLLPSTGGLGKYGNIYIFDTCIAIQGLLTYQRYLNGKIDKGILDRMASFVCDSIQKKQILLADDGSVPTVAPHWSTIFGASMLKTAIALDALSLHTGEEKYRILALEVAEEVIQTCFCDGAFSVFPNSQEVYCHAHCYALEGLLYLHSRGYRDNTDILRSGAERLLSWQNSNGSLFNWYNAPHRKLSQVGDATAQAIRIWLAVDRNTYLPAIQRGFAFLSSLRSPESGLYYCMDSKDVNSWTTMFAIQALDWYLNGVRAEWIF